MIKGINMRVIEVIDTSNQYYERAFLIVKPEYTSIEKSILEDEGKNIINSAGAPSFFKSKSLLINNLIKFTCAAVAGSAITAFILLF